VASHETRHAGLSHAKKQFAIKIIAAYARITWTGGFFRTEKFVRSGHCSLECAGEKVSRDLSAAPPKTRSPEPAPPLCARTPTAARRVFHRRW
jgi:hypothetical protein